MHDKKHVISKSASSSFIARDSKRSKENTEYTVDADVPAAMKLSDYPLVLDEQSKFQVHENAASSAFYPTEPYDLYDDEDDDLEDP